MRRFTVAAALATTLAGVLVASGAARAAPPERQPIVGVIEPAEKVREARFRFADLDGDGQLTRAELRLAGDTPIVDSQFPALDENGDGRLSEAEYALDAGRPAN